MSILQEELLKLTNKIVIDIGNGYINSSDLTRQKIVMFELLKDDIEEMKKLEEYK